MSEKKNLKAPLEQLFPLFYNFPTIPGQMQQKTLNISPFLLVQGASQVARVIKNLPASAEDIWDKDSTSGWGWSPGGGHGNPLQFLPGESHGQRSLAGYGGCKDWDTMEAS